MIQCDPDPFTTSESAQVQHGSRASILTGEFELAQKLGRGFSIETCYLRCVSSPDKSRVWHTRYLYAPPLRFFGRGSKPSLSSVPAAATVPSEHLNRIFCCSTSDLKSLFEGIFASESSRSPVLHNSLLDMMSFLVFLASSFPFILV